MEEKEIKLHLKACDICTLLLRDIKYISIPLMEKGVEDKIRYITMLELKCYYWLLDAFINEVRMSKAPDRSIFYVQERKLDDELKAEIISDQEKKKVHRVAKFEEFVSSIEAGDSAEMLVRKALNIGE